MVVFVANLVSDAEEAGRSITDQTIFFCDFRNFCKMTFVFWEEKGLVGFFCLKCIIMRNALWEFCGTFVCIKVEYQFEDHFGSINCPASQFIKRKPFGC